MNQGFIFWIKTIVNAQQHILSMSLAMLQMRIQPDEAIYYKLAIKQPGLEYNPVMSELDLSYKSRFKETYIPDAYERLILDAIRGDQEHFVRRYCLTAS